VETKGRRPKKGIEEGNKNSQDSRDSYAGKGIRKRGVKRYQRIFQSRVKGVGKERKLSIGKRGGGGALQKRDYRGKKSTRVKLIEPRNLNGEKDR